ncbi:MAG: hypothetical protein RLZZ381_1483 [Cyanobacteriota bacterium]|jgi:hypothetical protein
MSKITITQLNSETHELSLDEYKNIHGGEAIAVASFVVSTGLKLKGYQDSRIAPYENAAYQEYSQPDSLTGI